MGDQRAPTASRSAEEVTGVVEQHSAMTAAELERVSNLLRGELRLVTTTLDEIYREMAELRYVVVAAVEWYMAPNLEPATRKLGTEILMYLRRCGIEVGGIEKVTP